MSTIKSSAENLTLNADGANNDVLIQSNGSTKVTVDGATGAVGIGTASPAKTLEVNSGSGGNVARFTSTASEASIQLVNDARTWSWGVRDIGSNANAAFIHDNGASADRLVISTAGVVSIPVGIELGSGVDGTAANTLDDYEEGSWTPAYTPEGGSFSSIGYVGAIPGRYVKIGKQVTCFFYIGTDSVNTSGGSGTKVHLTGLPFAAENIGAGVWGTAVYSEKWGGDTPTHVSISANENKLRLWYRTSANGSSNNALGYSDMATGGDSNYVRGFITYTV
jgi:hypothetical protein